MRFMVPPQLDVPNWNIKFLNSSSVTWNIKSSGKRFRLRFTALFKLLVETWYSSAKSRSSMTFFPLIRYILLIITSSGIVIAVGIRQILAIRSMIAGNKIIYFQRKKF